MSHASRQLLVNATVILPDSVERGMSVLIDGEQILALDPVNTAGAEIVNLSGRLLIPGLIDLHCDALEKESEPRPGVNFPDMFACMQADRRNASAGITTVYHSLSFANHEMGVRNNAFAQRLCETVRDWNRHALVDNRVHARYEITDVSAPPFLEALMRNGGAQMISFMDHTPGQGQFKSIEAYRAYFTRAYQRSSDEVDQMLAEKQTSAADALERVRKLAALARECGIAIASHDDDNPGKVDLLRSLGATISEFPINIETAGHASSNSMATLLGAPNVLRGKSQSGSMKALDAVSAGVADCLCGDYSPASLLPAALRLTELAGLSIPDAITLVTRNPARAAGLVDRGSIAPGLRADLVSVFYVSGWPQAEQVWSRGQCVFSARLPVQPFASVMPISTCV